MKRKSLSKNEVATVLSSEPLEAGVGQTTPVEKPKRKVRFVKGINSGELITLENGETFQFPSVSEKQRKYYLPEVFVSEELAEELRKVATKYNIIES
jgi:predicted SnoaL-like aldol condensation-catalyzing enzyme